ncbi:MAG: 5-formyltetrahydrofolate cyclo-ligase [Clostridia bacterium]|nr:5-formyltetrahydrofolate cyclo-ligase [Clostridia bacterium]
MSTEQIRNDKREIRKVNKQKRAEMERCVKAELDKKICDNILNSMSFKYADTLLMFCPTEDEINVLSLFEAAKRNGKRVAFPKCFGKGIMKFYYVDDLSQLKVGKYGIKAPDEGEEFETSTHPLCIVPSLSATKKGTRLGYGGGFYDRFLHKFEGISMCVQYDEFVTDDLPQEKRYDKKFDVLVTESGVCVIGQ